MGRLDIHPGFVPVERIGVEIGDVLDRLAFGQGRQNHLVTPGFYQLLTHVAHVGDVFDLVDLAAAGLDDPADPVGHHIGAQVADMGVAVNRGPAGVHSDPVGF